MSAVKFLAGFVALMSCFAARAVYAADYAFDHEGKPYRVAFPLHERVWATGGLSWSGAAAPEFGLGWDFRMRLEFPDEEIAWRLRHAAFATSFRPQGQRLEASLVQAEYLRHDESSFVLVPGPNWKIPAPFDLAFTWTVLALSSERERLVEIEPFRGGLYLEFVRDPAFRSRFALGIEGSHALRADLGEHEIAPFSRAGILAAFERRDGLAALEAKAACGPVVVLRNGKTEWESRCDASVSLEWTPLAVNDLPLSLVAELAVGPEGSVALMNFKVSVPTE